MKAFTRPKYFSEAIAPVTILNCLLGVRVFEYPHGHPRPVLSLIYLLIMFGVYSWGSLHIDEKYYAHIRLMKLEYILYALLAHVMTMSVILKMLLGWWYTKRFKVCHKKLFEIDETLRQLGLSANYDNIYFITIGTITIWITAAFILSIVVFIHLHVRTSIFTSIYVILVYTYGLTVNAINVFEFFLFAKCLQMKFELVNRLLRDSLTDLSMRKMKLGIFEFKDYSKIMDAERCKHIPPMKTIFQWCLRTQRTNGFVSKKRDPVVSQIEFDFPSLFEKESELRNRSRRNNTTMTNCQKRKLLLQTIKQVHLELCKISKIVCAILGVQIALEIGLIIMFLTGSLYNLSVRYIMHQHKFKALLEPTIMTLSLCFLSIVKAIFLSRVCKCATNEGNRTIEIIHTIFECDADVNMREEIQQFGIQILQSPVTFSAFGLTLDNRLLSMILRTVTTYIVIMLQVSNTLESNNAVQYRHF